MDKSIKPIYYYDHPFIGKRGGAGWVWEGDVCYCHLLSVRELFLSEECDRPFTLVTEGGDLIIHDDSKDEQISVGFIHDPYLSFFNLKTVPRTLRRWYSTGVDFEHSKLQCCPLGLFDGYYSDSVPSRVIEKLMYQEHEKKNLCLIDFSLNRSEERIALHKTAAQYPWIKISKNKGKPYHKVLKTIAESKFVVCPMGNGLETARIWESLYLGAVPILIQTHWSKNFYGLPILQVESWASITEDELNARWDEYLQNKDKYDYSKINLDYWKEKINEPLQIL